MAGRRTLIMHHLHFCSATDGLIHLHPRLVCQMHDFCSGSCWLDVVPVVCVQYDCGYPARPGDKCGKAKGDCALPSEYDHECKCTKKFKDDHTVLHSKILSRQRCDILACSAICCVSAVHQQRQPAVCCGVTSSS